MFISFFFKIIWIIQYYNYFYILKPDYARNGINQSKEWINICDFILNFASTSGSGLFISQNRAKSFNSTLYTSMNAGGNYRPYVCLCLYCKSRLFWQCDISKLNISSQGIKLGPPLPPPPLYMDGCVASLIASHPSGVLSNANASCRKLEPFFSYL